MGLTLVDSSPLTNSLWLDGMNPEAFADTVLPKKAFVLVIGGGWAGIATAYYIAAFGGARVVLIDKGPLHWGSSGRNGGHLCPGVGDYGALVDQHGLMGAKERWNVQVRSVEELRKLVEINGIECDLVFGGHVSLASDEDGLERIYRSASLLAQCDLPPVEVWDEAQCQELVRSSSFVGGLSRPGAQISPGKLASGVAQAAVRLGVTIKTFTEVQTIQREGAGILVGTNHGDMVVDHVVFATNTAPEQIPVLGEAITPYRGQVIATRQLNEQIWPSNLVGFSTIDGLVYWLQTLTRRVVLGGMRHVVPGMERGVVDISVINPGILRAHRAYLAECFPSPVFPESLELQYSWTGLMAASKDDDPWVGKFSAPGYPDNVWIILGFGGDGSGITGAAYGLAEEVLEKPPTHVMPAFKPTIVRRTASV
jgi:gamma-glutamylputrescine oxidase